DGGDPGTGSGGGTGLNPPGSGPNPTGATAGGCSMSGETGAPLGPLALVILGLALCAIVRRPRHA
ncbi:MAG TPA: MYXO-CTERM sorting domain-containing protein, partial [Polyangia bacterium]